MVDPHESFPGLHPLEFVPEDELAKAKVMGRTAMERKFRGDFAEFSAELFVDLSRLDAISGVGGWAVYTQGADEPGSDLATDISGDTIIIFTPGEFNDSGRQTKTPTVRITKSEKIIVEDGIEFLTHDLLIDSDADAFYSYGSYPLRTSLDPEQAIVPIFRYDQEGRIGCSNPNVYMPRLAPGEDDDFKPEVTFIPFGHYSDPSTKLFVIEKMKKIFAELKGKQPFAWQGMANQTE